MQWWLRLFTGWLIATIVFASTLSVFLYASSEQLLPLFTIWKISFISTATISGISLFIGVLYLRITFDKRHSLYFWIFYPAAFFSTWAAHRVSLILHSILLSEESYSLAERVLNLQVYPSWIMTAILAPLFFFYRNFFFSGLSLSKITAEAAKNAKVFEAREEKIEVLQNRQKYFILLDQIIYIKAEGRKTVLHLTNGEKEISNLLKKPHLRTSRGKLYSLPQELCSE